MKKLFPIVAIALLCSSCLTRIVTTAVAPEPTTVVYTQPSTRVVYGHSYVQPTTTTTVVKTSPSRTTTTVVQVTPLNEDLSFFLDLRAVAAAFGEANSLREFEMLLNSSNYMLSSLDLNRDGYVDYLRVVEAIEGYNHVILIQAVLAPNIFQDVATLTVEMSYSTPYVQVIGAPYIYGPNYYVRPVYVRTPPMFAHFRGHGYTVWVSPYYWDYYPSCYHRPAPIYLSHYQAYVNTYMSNHHYCNRCEYDDRAHYSDYSRTSSSVTRKDFETRHPDQSFSNRMTTAARGAQSSGQGGASRSAQITNARDLQQRVASSSTTTTTTGSSRTATTSGNQQSTSRTSGSTGTTGSSRTTSAPGSSASSGSSRTSGTSGSTTSSSTSRTSGTSGAASQSGSSRTTGTTGSTSTSRTSGTSGQSASSRVAPASTTTSSRVSTNGTTRTTTKTVNTDGSSTTTRRGAATTGSSRTSSTSGSSRTSGTSGSSRTSGTSGASRTSGSSTPRR